MLELVVDEDELVRRLSGRRMLVDGEMVQRDDDKPETVRHRLRGLPGTDRAAVRVLRVAKGLLARIDAIGEVEEVTARALTALGVDGAPGSRAATDGRAAR